MLLTLGVVIGLVALLATILAIIFVFTKGESAKKKCVIFAQNYEDVSNDMAYRYL